MCRLPSSPVEPTTITDAVSGRDRALAWLLERGYRLVATDVRVAKIRVPIVVTDGPVTVFVDVKTIRGSRYAGAVELVDRRRAQLLVRAVSHYLAENPGVPSVRIDVVAVAPSGGGFARRDWERRGRAEGRGAVPGVAGGALEKLQVRPCGAYFHTPDQEHEDRPLPDGAR